MTTLTPQATYGDPAAAASRIAAVVGKEDPLTRRVAEVLSRHAYDVVHHRSPKDVLRDLLGEPASRPGTMARTGGTEVAHPALFVMYCHGPLPTGRGGTLWLDALKKINDLMPRTAILAAIGDRQGPEMIRGAIDAGADEILLAGDAELEELIWIRVQSALAKADTGPEVTMQTQRTRSAGVERRVAERRRGDRRQGSASSVAEQWEEPTPAHELRAAQERVRDVVGGLPRPEDRRGPLADLLGVTVPGLRAESGRLDAKKIAAALDVSLARLAQITPISRQALHDTPDSARAQAALDSLARILDVLGTVLPPDHARAWLNTPHARLGGETPLREILAGRAEQVARMLERARDGGVD